MQTCPYCNHDRIQHDKNGCTQADPDGKNRCTCTVTYMGLSPRKK